MLTQKISISNNILNFGAKKKKPVTQIPGQMTLDGVYTGDPHIRQRSEYYYDWKQSAFEDRETQKDIFQNKTKLNKPAQPSTPVIPAQYVRPKDIVMPKANDYLNTEGYELLDNTADYNKRIDLLNKTLSSEKQFSYPVNNPDILKDEILIQLLKKLKPDDTFKNDVVTKLANRPFDEQTNKNHYTRFSMISKALTDEIISDKNSPEFKKRTLNKFYDFLIKTKIHNEDKIKKIIKDLSAYKALIDNNSTAKFDDLRTALNSTIKKLPALIKRR